MKIYTRTGDDGTTALLGAGRLLKSDVRVEAYGTVDELNAALGSARAQDSGSWLAEPLSAIQSQLFMVGAELAARSSELLAKLDRVGEPEIAALEREIDRLDAELPPLKQFVLPAGTPFATSLHQARTVCRRAERRVVALAQSETVAPHVIRYLNRLADLLFVMARWSNQRAGAAEVPWRPEKRPGA
ncbi:MAG TPA: cob(I)yrinic acid a,c-diamide adenosyltransferase [Candidatus Limnocylindria bacterium]|nr:cob(I)yrinic acid a,c-diamide adenosyltransferase [Candidatus Limnocylindria bacterium]